MYLTSPTQDHSRKRRLSSPSLSNSHSAKRSNIGNTFNAFTDEQHAVIESTASFFHIHPSDLAAAIGSLQRSSAIPSYHQRPSYQDFSHPSFSHLSSTSEDSFGSQAAMTNEWEMSSSSSRDRTFGFNVLPITDWSSCFSNMLPEDDSSVPSDAPQTTYAGTKNLQRLANEIANSTYKDNAQLYKHSDSPFGSSTYLERNSKQATQEVEDSSMCTAMFACDAPFRIPNSWQLFNNNFSKPPPPQPSMTYVQQLDTDPFDRGLFPSGPGTIQPVSSANMQQTSLGKASLPYNNSEDECILIDFSVDDESNRPKRGPFKDPTEKAQTAQTRKDNACVRCKMQRTRCIPDPFDPRGVCLTCKKVANTRVVNLPCLRYKIPDARLFREGYVPGLEWSRRWDSQEVADISTWADSDIKQIEVSQGFSPNHIVLRVQKFIPLDGDQLTRKWNVGGIRKEVPVPPYAILNMKEAERAYRDYISKEGMQFFLKTLDRKDPLIFDTYAMAIKASKSHMNEQERVLLTMVLRLWVVTRMTCKSETIVGSERLGMRLDLMDQSSSIRGQTPIPPVMGRQIEVIVIQSILKPLRVMILELLQKLILAHKPQNWFCIYLCTFMLLHNASLVTQADIEYAKKHGLRSKFAMRAMIEELHMGVNVLLAYYHYSCRGQHPFNLDWDAKDALSMAILDEDQVSFLKRTAVHVQANASKHREIRKSSSCEDPHYFISQLYERDWEPRSSTSE